MFFFSLYFIFVVLFCSVACGTWSNWEIVEMINYTYSSFFFFFALGLGITFQIGPIFALLIWLKQSLIDCRMRPIKPMLCRNIPFGTEPFDSNAGWWGGGVWVIKGREVDNNWWWISIHQTLEPMNVVKVCGLFTLRHGYLSNRLGEESKRNSEIVTQL